MKNRSFLDSMSNALRGVISTFRHERNFKVQFVAGFFVFVAVLFVDVTPAEFLIILSAVIIVLVAELINTAVEAVVDLYCGEKYDEKAKIAKDASAGAVFLAAMYAVITGWALILRKLSERDYHTFLINRIQETPVHISIVCILITLMASILIKVFSGQRNVFRGGMPSAHSAVAFSAATSIMLLSQDVTAAVIAYFLAALVAQSRVEGRIHSVLQVVFGSLLGVFLTALAYKLISG
ncbi:MAG: diacylglycerol kinase [Clostridiales bacterium]|jgi:diacylglycerol kinase (ATP)|nr:diacylglycerol kinase [Clostridiales bacterium]